MTKYIVSFDYEILGHNPKSRRHKRYIVKAATPAAAGVKAFRRLSRKVGMRPCVCYDAFIVGDGTLVARLKAQIMLDLLSAEDRSEVWALLAPGELRPPLD